MIGARTQLVHLYVKDKTEGEDGLFQDYGFTPRWNRSIKHT